MLRRRDGLIRLEAGSAAQDWILARSYCAYTLVDAGAIPMQRRKGYAAMAIQRWSPFPDTRFHAEWMGPVAMVWSWSDRQARGQGEGATLSNPRRILPESLFRGEPRADGAELVAMDEGVEGRVWGGQVLRAAQWWDAPPALAEWNAFLRGAGMAATTALPPVMAPPLAHGPWRRQRGLAVAELTGQHRRALRWAGAGLAVLLLAIPAAACVRLLAKTAMLERVIGAESAAVADILSAREAAERDAARVEDLLALRTPARPLQLMAAVVAATPGRWTLREWRQPDPMHLEVVMDIEAPDPAAIVRGWEATALFSDVAVELDRTPGQLTARATLVDPAGSEP